MLDFEPTGLVAPAPRWDLPTVWASPAVAGGEASTPVFRSASTPVEAGTPAYNTAASTSSYGPPPGGSGNPPASPPPASPPPGGSGSPPSGSKGEPTLLGLMELDYLYTSARVVEDPGQTPYPDGPEVVDKNADGVIDDTVGDYSVPDTYVRGDTVIVTAKFQAGQTQPVRPGQTPRAVYVEGQGYTFHIPLTPLTDMGSYLLLPSTAATAALPNYVHVSGGISWKFYLWGGSQPPPEGQPLQEMPVVSASSVLYVTLDTPATTPVYHTLIDLSTTAAAWAATPQEVVEDTYRNAFATRSVYTALPAMGPIATRVRRPLFYYKNPITSGWDTQETTTEGLLRTGDGQCGAWVNFFLDTLKAHGIDGVERGLVRPKGDDKWLAVNNWGFTDPPAIPLDPYPYVNYVLDGKLQDGMTPGTLTVPSRPYYIWAGPNDNKPSR